MFYLLVISFFFFLIIVGISLYQRYSQQANVKAFTNMDYVKELTDEAFETAIQNGVTLIDFWAPWCNPCKRQMPVIQEIAKEKKEEVTCYKINVDEHKSTARHMKIKNIPNIIIFKDGVPVRQLIGAKPKHLIMKAVESTLQEK
ncbi:MAG: thioredoxin [bacterium]